MAADGGEQDLRQGTGQLCDHCGDQWALLYCRADSAKLCVACDRHVHSANAIFSRHSRAHLCHSCREQPAAILCASHGLRLCSNCDFDVHPPAFDGPHHDRRPLEPFSGCPSSTELASLFGFQGEKSLWVGNDDDSGSIEELGDGFLNDLVWEVPSIVSMQDLAVPVEARSASSWEFQAVGVPPPPKNHRIASGKHRNEILKQLRSLFKAETLVDNHKKNLESEPVPQYLLPDHDLLQQSNVCMNVGACPASEEVPGCKEILLQRSKGHNEAKNQVSSSHEKLAVTPTLENVQVANGSHKVCNVQAKIDDAVAPHLDMTENSSLPPKAVYELLVQDREKVISRYKEKKKARRYDKQIRYESRKTRADERARVRGRFAKAIRD